MFDFVGRSIASYLTKPIARPGGNPAEARLVENSLIPGDVLLVEGNTRISAAIKYLTQSTWTHAALFVGPRQGLCTPDGARTCLIEADVLEGVRAVPVARYGEFRVRICRPVKLTPSDCERVVRFLVDRLGYQYDLKNVLDLARYLLPTPLPARYRRRLMAFGSGDPSRAICSTLIAEAFGTVNYPILPVISRRPSALPGLESQESELWRIRHHSLYVPRDFDMSPFFEVVKPRIAAGFDYQHAPWSVGRTVIMGDIPPTEMNLPKNGKAPKR